MQTKDLTKDITFEDFKTEVLNDYTVAVTSRECSLLGRREVLTGKAKFGIFGDKGIDSKVDSTFWNDTRDVMRNLFKKGEFKEGIIQGIQTAIQALEIHFPWEAGDTDELSNSISKGEDL